MLGLPQHILKRYISQTSRLYAMVYVLRFQTKNEKKPLNATATIFTKCYFFMESK